MLNNINACLDSFLNVLQQLLQNAARATSTSAMSLDALSVAGGIGGGMAVPMSSSGSSSSSSSSRIPYAVPLNNLSLSGEFAARLRTELEAAAKKSFAAGKGGADPKSVAKIDVAFNEMGSMASSFRTALSSNLKQVAQTLEPSLRDISEGFANANFVLAEKDYALRQAQDEDAWTSKLIVAFDALLKPFSRALVPMCFEFLARTLCVSLAGRLERAILLKKYNALGALQLTREVHVVSQALIAACPSCRTDMARISQMCVALSVDRVVDIEELSNAPQWRLTPGETRRLLSRRIEFSSQEIAAIKL